MKAKSIGIYFQKESLQIIRQAKTPDEAFGSCVNRLIQESILSRSQEWQYKEIIRKMYHSLDQAVNQISIPTTEEEDKIIMMILGLNNNE